MEEPLISIIVPVYNVEKYLKRCIESVICQTYKKLEIIIIDDGSTDDSGKICDEYKKKDSRIKVLHKKNTGLSDTRNKGIELVKGKFLTFIDSDDYVNLDYIECLYNSIVKYNVSLSICNFNIVWKKVYETREKGEFLLNSEQAFKNLLFAQGIDVSACGKLYKTSLWNNIRFPIGRTYEDTATIYKVIHKAKKVVYNKNTSYFYIARRYSISKQSKFNSKEIDYIQHTQEMLSFVKNKYPNLSLAVDRFDLYSKFRILRMLIFTKPRNKEQEQGLIKSIKILQKNVFFAKETPKRDKIAIISLCLGLPFFRFAWKMYVKFTGRIT